MAAAKKWMSLLPILIGVVIVVGIIVYIVVRDHPQFEGFAAPILNTPKCPDNFTFFNDKRGDSFCCAGQIDPYSHKCEASGDNQLCAMKPNVQDPRKTSPRTLPLCSAMIRETHTRKEASCPGTLPNFASIGKCCKTQADLDGYDCRKHDNEDKKRYCKLAPPLLPGEQLCNNLNMAETAQCPSGFAKISYQLGDREVQKYGTAAAGVQMPVCFGMDKTCIPDNIVKDLQSRGLYNDKNSDLWEYSCKGWKTAHVDRDLTKTMDKTYI